MSDNSRALRTSLAVALGIALVVSALLFSRRERQSRSREAEEKFRELADRNEPYAG